MTLCFITLRTYGTWLRGHDRGWFDRKEGWHRGEPNAALVIAERRKLKHAPFTLSREMRSLVEETIRASCARRGWTILALWVDRTHVHIVLEANRTPEEAMRHLKSKCTRALRCAGLIDRRIVVWSRHGSTVHLNSQSELDAVIDYVTEHKGAAD